MNDVIYRKIGQAYKLFHQYKPREQRFCQLNITMDAIYFH